MKYRRITGILTAAAMMLLSVDGALADTARQPEEEKQYIVIAEDASAYQEAAEEIGDSIVVETPVLSENNVIVAELTKDEAAVLSENEDLLVEEDITLCASTAADENDENPVTVEEYRQRKEEIKRRKQEQLEEEHFEEDTEEAEYEWNLQAVNADEAIEEEDSAQDDVKVAVLDSGVDYVTGMNLAGYVNFVEEEDYVAPIFQDLTGHGTGVASIITGNGENGLYGVNPNAKLYSVKVLDAENKAPLSRIIRGIYWCIENDMNIINMSFGTSAYSKALEKAVTDAYEAGLLMVAAAGNGGTTVEYPAAFPEVMAVASTNTEAEISDFSNTGEELDVAAPGEKIRVASYFNGNTVTHGTSIAVPHVTGVASLLWEKDLTKSNEFIRQLINHSAKDISGTDECGLLDAKYAMDCYDAFAEGYDESKENMENVIENAEQPETFEEVDADDTYVEGRWHGKDHKAAVDAASSGLTAAVIKIVKQGAVYPDEGELSGSDPHAEWHGKWRKDNENSKEVNYCAVLEMVTEIALEGGTLQPYMTCDWFRGMNQTTYNTLKKDIANLKSKCATLLSSNTKENRKYFLYGCALHSIQDTFAHSTTRSNGTFINHNSAKPDTAADTVEYYPTRYKVAAKLTEYILQNLKDGIYSDGSDVIEALKVKYADVGTYKVIKLKKYMSENGYTHSIVTKANIDKPVDL